MKTALIVKEDGLIYAAEVPECQMCEGECIHNPDPKDSAVLVSDQEKAIRLIYESLGETTPIWNGWINMFKKNAVPKVYPMPDLSWEVVGMDETGNSNCSDDNVVQEVAILKESTPSTEQQKHINVTQSEQDPCLSCGKSVREQLKGCNIIYCYRQFLPKKTEQESQEDEFLLHLVDVVASFATEQNMFYATSTRKELIQKARETFPYGVRR